MNSQGQDFLGVCIDQDENQATQLFYGLDKESGKQGALLPLAPLRTVHAAFTAHGSDLSKTSFLIRLFCTSVSPKY
jgi:hypothetical protein